MTTIRYSVWNYDGAPAAWVAHGQSFPRSGVSEAFRSNPSNLLPNCPADLKGPNAERYGWFSETRTEDAPDADQLLAEIEWGEPDFEAGTVVGHRSAVAMTSGELATKLAADQAAVIARATAMGLEVDSLTGAERLKYTSLQIPGQSSVYGTKYAEAVAWTADNQAPTPYLSAEATATGKTLAERVALVLATGQAWISLDIQLEAHRMGLKEALIAAAGLATDELDPDPAAAHAALDAIDVSAGWPQPQ